MSNESTGGSCSYYVTTIECPYHSDPYTAECGDITDQLEMNPREANIFKEIWRMAAARQGKKKKGNSALRGAQKIKFFADRILQLEEHKK